MGHIRPYCPSTGPDLHHSAGFGPIPCNVGAGPSKSYGIVNHHCRSCGGGLLGLDFLHLADAWVGLKDGRLHMKVGDNVLTCTIRPEHYPIRYIARSVGQPG
jgi:hypothetical protein